MKIGSEKNWTSAFTWAHLLAGYYAGKTPLRDWLLAHTLFEIIENSKAGVKIVKKIDSTIIETFTKAGIPIEWPSYGGDALKNSVGDTIATAIGWGLRRK
tara:strand:- start:774 stop:1073 length:300 start_codon:yes stop_codon:yes gene_type:complete